MAGKFPLDKSLGEVAIIYAVVEDFPDQDGKVIMTVCFRISVMIVHIELFSPISIPINGVCDRIFCTLSSMLGGGEGERDSVNQAVATMIQRNNQSKLKGRFFCLKGGASPWLSKTRLSKTRLFSSLIVYIWSVVTSKRVERLIDKVGLTSRGRDLGRYRRSLHSGQNTTM